MRQLHHPSRGQAAFALLSPLLCLLIFACAEAAEPVIAIDVLLLPDATMVGRAKAANARLREDYPQGYTLGPAQVAHITLLQRYVRTKHLQAIEEAVAKVLAKEDPRAYELTAIGYAYAPWAGVAITSIAVPCHAPSSG